ncbi:hydroxymethylpyrimidine/phosphomethylpyrimidine kinase [Desulfobaculum xiamenense]|uniref:hydroxymethylpyrimidine kinase n=1 Tax=Desulfobaculum xiamenense TaxID=995050 RepID=A0A846QFE6_9BACT|nr:bifunctional hydroxymethylpyrimidine kinase/phosphomethylpyrimidine kinase [Desulfobaculum xiamenense]NJB66961.1 hydroxymethylpyrimidine/phosphomethylpyrimidine kinase [Desulfobaculum xiamenense]
MNTLPCILTIAGSDSGGGAGIQADIKTIAMNGGYAMSVITALTAQNSMGITGIHAPDPEFVAWQLRAVLDDFPLAAAKTGMLFSGPIIAAVCDRLAAKTFPLVVDPVSVSQTGHQLLKDDAIAMLVERLVPLADVFTPNRPEAEVLTGLKIDTPADVRTATARLQAMGAKAVLLKGGHFDGDRMIDWLALPGAEPIALEQPRIDTVHTHGTGCTLSSAIATWLGRGYGVREAVVAAQKYLNLALRAGFGPGRGAGPANHSVVLLRLQERERIREDMGAAVRRLEHFDGMRRLLPEGVMHLVAALPWASGGEDVASLSGGVSCDAHGRPLVAGCPEFGASGDGAGTVLAASAVRAELRFAAVLPLTEAVTAALGRSGLGVAWFDRADAPEAERGNAESLAAWGVRQVLSSSPAPQGIGAVCDFGGNGSVGAVRILGAEADEVLDRLEAVADALD